MVVQFGLPGRAAWLWMFPVLVWLQAASGAQNLLLNSRFHGAAGQNLGVSGTVPDAWRGFAVGGAQGELTVVPVARNELYAGSPATFAVKWKVSAFGADQGFDNNNQRFPIIASHTYRLEFYVKTGNANGSNQLYRFGFPLFDANGYLGVEPGGRSSNTARSTWTKVTGPSFSHATATEAHVSFRVQSDGGEDSILIAMPTVSGPPMVFTPPSAAELAQRPTWSASDRIIGTSYFYWYRWPDLHFFDDAAMTDDGLTDHFPQPQTVSMESRSWHKKELADVAAAGIDMIWPVYWAAPGNFDHATWNLYISGLTALQQALDELEAEGKTTPRVGMFYDTSSLLNAVRGVQPLDGSADLTTPEGRDVFYNTIRSFFCSVKPRRWACVNGRPIVVLYTSSFASAHDQTVFNEVATRFAAEFGGITPYIIREASWQASTSSSYRWGAALDGPYLDGAAGVGAGYDDSGVTGRFTPIRMREDGNYYRWSWLQVLRSPRNIVHLETWNEMHEGTSLCESAEYGRQYIDLTAHYAAHFRAGTVPDESVTLVHPHPEPRPPNMQDGAEYAGAAAVEIRAQDGAKVQEGIDDKQAGDGSVAVVSYAGQTWLRSDAAANRYAYFAVKDPFYFDQRRRVQITLEYLDEGSGAVQLQYDSYNVSGTFAGSYTNATAFTLGNTGTLKTQTLVLEDARFANRQNSGADFRYYVAAGPLYIKRIRVEVLPLPEPVLRVQGVAPLLGGIAGTAPHQIVAGFTTNPLASSLIPASFRLTGSGGDGIFGNANDLEITPASITTAGSTATFSIAGTLPEDLYQVTLVGRGFAPVRTPAGRPLDGRFTGTFPSGDGTGGLDFVTTFTVQYWIPDFDGDSDVDQEDFGTFQACLGLTGTLLTGACLNADLTGDGIANHEDLDRFLNCLSGPGVTAVDGCQN